MGTRPIHTVVYKGTRVPVSRYLELERSRVKDEVDLFTNAFSKLEYALSGLLHAILGASTKAKYHTPYTTASTASTLA
jgi:hypothetical protein